MSEDRLQKYILQWILAGRGEEDVGGDKFKRQWRGETGNQKTVKVVRDRFIYITWRKESSN